MSAMFTGMAKEAMTSDRETPLKTDIALIWAA
jgi:hypothetical protein